MEKATALLLEGYPARLVSDLAGINKNTSISLRNRLVEKHGVIKCKCGKESNHNGFCKWRMQFYPKRTEFVKTFGGRKPGCKNKFTNKEVKKAEEIVQEDEKELSSTDKSIMDGHAAYCELLTSGKISNGIGGPPIQEIVIKKPQKKKINYFSAVPEQYQQYQGV